MNRNERYEASKDWRRASDVPVSKATAEIIEKLACAHLAEGDAGMFKLAMSSLARCNKQAMIAYYYKLLLERYCLS